MNKVYFAFVLSVVFFLAGCTSELVIDPFETDWKNRIRLSISDIKDVTVYSTATNDENRIDDCFVVVFQSDGTYRNGEKINVGQIANNGSASPLLPQLSFDLEDGDKVYVICNTGLAALPAGIMSESDMDAEFILPKDYYWEGEALPMSGRNASFSKINPYAATVEMIRSVAKVQVVLGETFNIGGFENIPEWNGFVSSFDESLCGFVMANYAGKSKIMHDASGLSQNLSGLPAFYGATGENKFLRFTQYAGNSQIATMYVSEYPNSTKDCEGNTISASAFDEKRQFLLMFDKVQNSALLGDGTKTNAWRIDFYDMYNEEYLDIKRNHHYIFTINKIRSMPYVCNYPGSAQISDAFTVNQEVWHNPGSNIEYTVVVKEEWATNSYSNGQYALSLSTDTIDDENTVFSLTAQLPSGVDGNQITTHVIRIFDRNGSPIGQPGDNLEVSGCSNRVAGISFPADGSVTTLTFTVNDYTDLDSAYMDIHLGNIYKRVFIMLNPWIYMPDAGFREFCLESGYISAINPSNNNYVKISSAGRATTTINMNREGYRATVSASDVVRYGGLYASGGFSHIPDIISNTNLSDINTVLWTPVSDLTGIEHFPNLENLYLNGNALTSLDLSANKKLVRLDAENNPLTSVTFDNPDLDYVDLLNTELSAIDVTNCKANMRVMMVTGYSSLASNTSGTTIGAGLTDGVRFIYTSVMARGSIFNEGSTYIGP